MIKVLFFGPVAERIGGSALQVEHRVGMRLQDLRDELAARHPQAFDIVCFAAVNGGRITSPTAKPDPVTLAMLQKLIESITAIGQNLAQGKQAGQQQMMQQMMQMMGGKDGGSHK